MSDTPNFKEITSLLDADGPVALIIKQELAPDDEEEKTIFPPTYPMTQFKGRVQRFEQGEYRVSIELPPDTKRDKDERKDNQKPGYQIDRFADGTNICEIDSIQSQSNRIEPQFKTIRNGELVPQITIAVGSKTVNLLDAGHRAADAVVRMSSLAAEFHKAWQAAKAGDLLLLAKLAPTAVVFGAWDSRSSQAKLQRLIKAHIRATNVLERTRSAQYSPPADYVAAGVVSADVNQGEDDKNNLSQEGMKHALSTQTVGGVMLTSTSKLTRTVNVNFAAIRDLRASGVRPPIPEDATEDDKAKLRKAEAASVEERTRALREYILGITLVAAYARSSLNLREGSNLQEKSRRSTLVQDNRKHALPIDESKVEAFALDAGRRFFSLASGNFDDKDLHGVFESGVAEEFLSMPTADRDKIRALGPITAETLKRFAEIGKDPFKLITEIVKATKEGIGKAPAKTQPRVKRLSDFKPLADALKGMADNVSLNDEVRALAKTLVATATEHDDSHAAIKDIDAKLKEFKKPKKAEPSLADSAEESGAAQ